MRPQLQASFADLDALRAAYLPFVQQGALFVECEDVLALGTELDLHIALLSQPSVVIDSQVVWRVPVATEKFRHTGVGVQFKGKSGAALHERIQFFLEQDKV